MEIDRPLRSLEPGPIEHRGAQLNERRIQSPEWMLESEPPSLQGRDGLATAEDVIEERLVQLPQAMGIGIGER